MNEREYFAYYEDVTRRVCRLLDLLPDQHSMTRARIGAELFEQTGSTILASVIGTLLRKGYVEKCPPAFRERGPRFRLTDRGKLAVELLDALGDHATEIAS